MKIQMQLIKHQQQYQIVLKIKQFLILKRI